VARGTRWSSATQCHGLAGSAELLLDFYQALSDPAYLAEAHSIGRLLEAYATERDGLLVWPSEMPFVYSPDYMVGFAGVAVALLRLADPERRPHQLSRRGFRHTPGAAASPPAFAHARQADRAAAGAPRALA
jgi:hypothetical protein